MTPGAPADARESGHRGVLALALQELLTAVARVRTNRQSVADATTFRNHFKQLLSSGHEEARRSGYASEDVKLAIYAVVVFLDESVLNSPHPAFAGWSRQPLQEEVFGGHRGGEGFYENLRALLGRQDSDDLADVLEVYELCLLLGFRGRYGAAGGDELRRWTAAVSEKVGRIRGVAGGLSPQGALPANETIPVAQDPWLPRLLYGAAGCAAAAFIFFLIFRLILLPAWLADVRAVQVP
jgi:type VI secretion system protein ImpK